MFKYWRAVLTALLLIACVVVIVLQSPAVYVAHGFGVLIVAMFVATEGRFTLRTLFMATTLIAVALGLIVALN